METHDFNKELLEYIYEEMNSEQRKDFEKKLEENSALQDEYNSLVSVRQQLDSMKDKEVMEPFSTWGKAKHSGWFSASQKRKIIVFKPITAVAASLLILMLLGYLTNFSVSINDNGFKLGFGGQSISEVQKGLSAEDVKSLVSEEVQRNNELWLTRLTNVEQSYNSKIASLESSVKYIAESKAKAPMSNEELQKIFASSENKSIEVMKEYLKLTSTQQQDYFKAMFTQFNDYYQKQRSEDLTFYQNTLMEVKQDQSMQKKETDQAIASLFTTVGRNSN